ncbi:hypothetical protein, partial [Acidihalobacter prosperus]
RQRARDLGQLARCIERYANEFGELPTTLGILGNTGRYTSCTYWMHDPQTKRQYAYRIITASKKQGLTKVGEFELCANFSLANKNTERKPGYGLSIPSTWNTHNAGRSCKSIIARLGKVKSR